MIIIEVHISMIVMLFMPARFMITEEERASGKLARNTPRINVIEIPASCAHRIPMTSDSGTASMRMPSQIAMPTFASYWKGKSPHEKNSVLFFFFTSVCSCEWGSIDLWSDAGNSIDAWSSNESESETNESDRWQRRVSLPFFLLLSMHGTESVPGRSRIGSVSEEAALSPVAP